MQPLRRGLVRASLQRLQQRLAVRPARAAQPAALPQAAATCCWRLTSVWSLHAAASCKAAVLCKRKLQVSIYGCIWQLALLLHTCALPSNFMDVRSAIFFSKSLLTKHATKHVVQGTYCKYELTTPSFFLLSHTVTAVINSMVFTAPLSHKQCGFWAGRKCLRMSNVLASWATLCKTRLAQGNQTTKPA